MSVSQALATPVDDTVESIGVGPAQWVPSGAAMPSVPERSGAQEGQRHAGQPGPATPWSCAHSRRTTPNSTSVIGSRSIPIRNHCERHFPVQNVAKATYREILERRAKANGVDFIEGVATAITPIAFFETVMVKSYETLVDSDTKVDVNTGIVAAGRLQSLIDSRDYSRDLLVMKVQLGQICEAVRVRCPAGIDVGRDRREAGGAGAASGGARRRHGLLR